jgi:papain like protease
VRASFFGRASFFRPSFFNLNIGMALSFRRGHGALRTPDHIRRAIPTMPTARGVIPPTLSLIGDLLPVRDQGDTEECVAFAMSCIKEYLERKNVSCYFSPQFIYDRRSNKGASGMFPADAMNIVKTYGLVYDRDYPLVLTGTGTPIANISYASSFRIASYASIVDADTLKQTLANQGPCLITLPVFNYSSTFWKPRLGDKEIGGHGLAVVGYTASAFILRNSWGSSWGNNGYCYLPFSDFSLAMEIYGCIDVPNTNVTPPQPEPIPPPPPTPLTNCCSCVLL